ncbi:MAG: DNA-directed RNA polymerase subunit alpha, partial [Nitrospinales bacterium]
MGYGIVKPKRLEFDKKTKTDFYGKFVAGPFERGYGTTIGNSLRRMLLSSIQGGAIIGVKMEGIFHEFSSIPGVVEDVTDIILNLKRINLKMNGEEDTRRIYLKSDKVGEVCARDITEDPNITILNPDYHIATIDENGHLDMEMIVKKGWGYVPADQHKLENESIQMIP